MFEYISQHWYVGVALAALIILTIFVWFKAIQASRRHNIERDRIIAELEKEKALRSEFRHIDELTFADGKDDYRLIIGMCAFVQMKIEKKDDMNAAFLNLPEEMRFIYGIGYVFDDSVKKLSEFFRSNGQPLLLQSKLSVDKIVGGRFAEIFDIEYKMLDDDDETTSVDNNKLEELDKEFAQLISDNGNEIYKKVSEYIKDNKDVFLRFELS